MKSRKEQKELTRRKLIDTALKLSAEKGFSSISLREVTTSTGISPSAFYRHFNDMEELGLSLLDEVGLSLRRLLRSARRDLEKSSTSVTEYSIEVFLDYVNNNKNLFRVLLGERQGASINFRRAIHSEIDRFVSELTEDLERISKDIGYELRSPPLTSEAIVAVVFTVGAEALDLSSHKQVGLKNRLIEEVNMILRGSKVYSKRHNSK